MTTVKISELPTGTLSGDSELPASTAGSTIKTTPNSIVASSSDGLNTITSDYTLQTSDSRKLLIVDSSSPVEITIVDSTSFPNGFNFEVMRKGTGTVNVTGSGFNVTVGQFSQAELSSEGSVAKVTKIDANEWVMRGDLKETQPRAAFTLENQGPTGSAGDLFDLEGVAGQDGAPAAWQVESNGTATCLIGGLYQFSGVVYIRYTDTGSNQNGVISFTKNGSVIRDFARGVRESSSNGIVIATTVYGWEKFAKGDIFRVYAPQVGTNINTLSSARQFWATRISD